MFSLTLQCGVVNKTLRYSYTKIAVQKFPTTNLKIYTKVLDAWLLQFQGTWALSLFGTFSLKMWNLNVIKNSSGLTHSLLDDFGKVPFKAPIVGSIHKFEAF